MTEIHSQQKRAGYTNVGVETDRTGWVGWILFAGIMLILVGSFQAIAGFVALFNDSYYVVPSRDLVVTVDYTGWGWTHIALGALAIAAGYGVMSGKMWARVLAIFAASVAAIVNLSFLKASPVWSTILITMDVLVIWAVAVHGREVRSDY